MKTPIYEQAPGALVALLNAPPPAGFVSCNLYTITLFGTQGIIRLCDAQIDVTYGGHTWAARNTVQIDQKQSKAVGHWKRGADVDSWVVVIAPRNVDPITGAAFPDKIGTVPWIAAARGGAIDGADIQVDRAYFSAWPVPYRTAVQPVGVLTIFAGQPAEVDTSDTLVVLTLNDYRDLLAQKLPLNLYQAGCRHTLYAVGCNSDGNMVQSNFAVNGVCIGGTTRQQIAAAPIVPPTAPGSGTFSQGKIVMTSGLNAGFSRTVTAWTAPGTFAFVVPFPFDVLTGDTFTAYPGCDKQGVTCGLFANSINFGGETFVPDATTAI